MMKMLPGVAAVAILGSISTSCLAGGGSFFINASAGQANYRVAPMLGTNLYGFGSRLDSNSVAGAIRFGYRWHDVVDYGFEAGYADFGKIGAAYYPPYANRYQANLKGRGWVLGGNLKYDIGRDWYLSARGGWFRAYVDNWGSVNFFPHCSPSMVCPAYVGYGQWNYSRAGNGRYFGLGGGFNFSPNFSLGLSYDRYFLSRHGSDISVDVESYSMSVEYRF